MALPCIGQAQSYTLSDCINIALTNNLDLKSATLATRSSNINYDQSKWDRLPNLNANYNIGLNNGRSIDPFTNDYINQGLSFSNAGVNLSATVFNGFRIKNNIKQNHLNLQASEMEVEEAQQNLMLDVTLQYIQILNNRDAIGLAKSRLETTENQLERLKARYEEGVGNPVDYTDMQGQYTVDQMALISAEDNLKSAVLQLSTLLNLATDSEKEFENIDGLIASEKYPFSVDDIYNDALQNLATFKSKRLRIEAASAGIDVAKANYFPEVSVFGQINTNYSSVAEVFTETGTTLSETGDFVNISNQDYPVLRNKSQFRGDKISYDEQFTNNLNSVIGVSVRIPIFNGFISKNRVALRQVELEQTIVVLERTELVFKQAITQAYNNMESSFDRYYITLKQVEVFEESFRVNEIRFNNGVSNIVDYITSKNNMDAAKLNLSRTKYEYLLRVKVLDYYRGA